jgi:hypothetical protein
VCSFDHGATRCGRLQHFGGAEGIRTPDPLHAMQVRYQLRHSPKAFASLQTACGAAGWADPQLTEFLSMFPERLVRWKLPSICSWMTRGVFPFLYGAAQVVLV